MAAGISSEAVMFFDDNRIVKEMLYPEFQAVLDHVVGIDEFDNQQVRAAYVRINGALQLTHVVLFLVDFAGDGYVDRAWNIPLSHLADKAAKGPDLGGGAIRLSCRSQCSVSWHQRSLWDPDAHAGNTTLKALAAAAKRNRLGLTVMDEPEQAPLSQNTETAKSSGGGNDSAPVDVKALEKQVADRLSRRYQEELKKRLGELQEEHRLRVATMKSEAQDHIQKLQALYRGETEKVKQALETTKQLFAEEKHKNLQLKQTLEERASELKNVREKFQAQVVQNKEVGQQQLLELEERFEAEARAKIDTATAELKEMLDMREVELFYRDEQVGRLNAEIAELRREKQDLLDSSGDRVLHRLAENGITFVAYQPGTEQLTVPLRDISDYLDAPLDYVAEKNALDPEHYKRWVAHINNPVCSHRDDDDRLCGERLVKVEKPSRFVEGESDRCARHNRAASKLNSLIKARGSN